MLSLSFVSVFGDTGNITVVSGKSYQINYDAKYVQVISVQPNKEDQGLVFSIQATSPIATLEVTLPRELIDAPKKDGSSDFIVLLDNAITTTYVEKSSNQTSRTILIQLAPENKELEIIGTSLAGSNASAGTTQTPTTQPPIPTTQQTNQTQQTQNNTSLQQKQTSTPVQKPTEIPSEKPKINFFNITGNQIIGYSVIASVILILIIVIASSKSKARKQIQK
jgi:hypothetical protein